MTDLAIAATIEGFQRPGAGFLEKVYQRALIKELSLRGVRAIPEASIAVFYKGERVGDYYAEILVEDVLMSN